LQFALLSTNILIDRTGPVYINMYIHKYLAALVFVLAVGCSSAGEKRLPIDDPDFPERPVDEIYLERFALEDFQTRLDAAAAHLKAGNRYLFLATRDSLVVDVNAYIRENPHMETNSTFGTILNRLAALDTMSVEASDEPYTSYEDSLALSFADWPTLDIELDDGVLFDKYNTAFPEISNQRIDFWINYYTGPGKARFERAVYRMQLYRPVVEEILEELGLPPELICVALVESGFSMKAVSRARAVGPWQFIHGTGKLYGLRVNWWYDERRNIVASTYAAGNYLKDLYSIWNDWYLALAAYNCGEYRVARAVGRHRTEDFWHLQLPKQTERYVPKFLAALYILRDMDEHGIHLPPVEPIEFDQVRITDATDLSTIARCADTTLKVIRDLNPECLRWTTPPKTEIMIKVPKGKGEGCTSNLAKIPPEERVTWTRHRIKRGETLSVIARKYGVSVSSLKTLNGIRNAHRIREGQMLIVPLQGHHAEVASSKPMYKSPSRKIDKNALENYAKRSAPPKGYKRVDYVVRQNDTLGEIAEIYGTSARKIRAWNNLSYRRYIYPGQKLALYVPEPFKLPQQRDSAAPNQSQYVKRVHVVKKGETFYSISRSYNVRLDELLVWNNKHHRSIIHPGDVLEIWTHK
jgi:membrane-bound lytic murein transglycosylase D